MAHVNTVTISKGLILSVGHEAMSFKPYHQSKVLTHKWGAPLISRHVLSIGKQTFVTVSAVCPTIS